MITKIKTKKKKKAMDPMFRGAPARASALKARLMKNIGRFPAGTRIWIHSGRQVCAGRGEPEVWAAILQSDNGLEAHYHLVARKQDKWQKFQTLEELLAFLLPEFISGMRPRDNARGLLNLENIIKRK